MINALIAAATVLAALGCGLAPTPTPASSAPGSLDLAPGMQIGVVSTTFGGFGVDSEVNSERPGGGMLVTIEEVQPGESVTVAWQRTVERDVTPAAPTPVVGVGTPDPTPPTETVTERGVITGNGRDDSHAALLPIFWPQVDGETTDTSLMWLSAAAFSELKETRETRWSADVLTRISNLPREALDKINDAAAGREIFLKAEPDFVTFELSVNGQNTTVQAIKAFDDFGNAYVILDNPQNPLILKFTYNAVSTGAIGIDVGIWTLIKAVFSGHQVVEIRQPAE